MFLHEDPELFRDIIEAASASQNNRPIWHTANVKLLLLSLQ